MYMCVCNSNSYSNQYSMLFLIINSPKSKQRLLQDSPANPKLCYISNFIPLSKIHAHHQCYTILSRPHDTNLTMLFRVHSVLQLSEASSVVDTPLCFCVIHRGHYTAPVIHGVLHFAPSRPVSQWLQLLRESCSIL